jgi:DNA-binding response OmpR family regulator
LSAKGTEMDRVHGLDLGADDYMTKPFGLHELLARVKALLRRSRPPAAEKVIPFGEVEADFAAGEVRRRGVPVEMTARELQLLQYLISREGRVVTRQMILDAVWGEGYFGTERTVDNFITRLRQKLDDPDEPVHFMTVRGMGYRFRGEPK